MSYRTTFLVLLILLVGTSAAFAGNVYKVTSQDGDETITYDVKFGGGKRFEQFTAFDPESKKFVYLSFERDGKEPAAAMKIWDHRTGETISLYKFPEVENPLPVIPSIKAMKVCPITGDKNFESKLHVIYD